MKKKEPGVIQRSTKNVQIFILIEQIFDIDCIEANFIKKSPNLY